jgi:ABC-type dipeptide/oligopeptide/nickel transport system permease component
MMFGISVLVFLTMHLAPGDPAQLVAGLDAPPEVVERIRKDLGLDRPIWVQYAEYAKRVLKGDFGRSLHSKTRVSEQLIVRLPVTIKLALLALGFGLPLGIVTGVISATRHQSWFDHVAMVVALIGASVPIFFLGLLLLLLFALNLGWFPISGGTGLKYLVLPAITLGTRPAALISRLTRTSMLEVLREDYIRVARSKGLTERVVVYKHGLRNALTTVITAIGVQMGVLLAGSVVTEAVFGLPGIGQMMVGSILNRDFPMVQAPLLIIAAWIMLVNLMVDILYTVIDPTIRYS